VESQSDRLWVKHSRKQTNKSSSVIFSSPIVRISVSASRSGLKNKENSCKPDVRSFSMYSYKMSEHLLLWKGGVSITFMSDRMMASILWTSLWHLWTVFDRFLAVGRHTGYVCRIDTIILSFLKPPLFHNSTYVTCSCGPPLLLYRARPTSFSLLRLLLSLYARLHHSPPACHPRHPSHPRHPPHYKYLSPEKTAIHGISLKVS
jgi:hypothetical protein